MLKGLIFLSVSLKVVGIGEALELEGVTNSHCSKNGGFFTDQNKKPFEIWHFEQNTTIV